MKPKFRDIDYFLNFWDNIIMNCFSKKNFQEKETITKRTNINALF